MATAQNNLLKTKELRSVFNFELADANSANPVCVPPSIFLACLLSVFSLGLLLGQCCCCCCFCGVDQILTKVSFASLPCRTKPRTSHSSCLKRTSKVCLTSSRPSKDSWMH